MPHECPSCHFCAWWARWDVCSNRVCEKYEASRTWQIMGYDRRLLFQRTEREVHLMKAARLARTDLAAPASTSEPKAAAGSGEGGREGVRSSARSWLASRSVQPPMGKAKPRPPTPWQSCGRRVHAEPSGHGRALFSFHRLLDDAGDCDFIATGWRLFVSASTDNGDRHRGICLRWRPR